MSPSRPFTTSRKSAKIPDDHIIDRGVLRFRIYTQSRKPEVRSQKSDLRPPTSDLRQYTSYTLAYRLNGRRHRIARARWEDILTEIDTAERAIANGQTDLLDFSAADKALLQRLRELASGAATPLEILVSEAVEARAKQSRTNIVHKHCPKIIEEYLARRGHEMGAKWRRNFETMADRIAAHFTGPLTAYETHDISEWLDSLAVGLRTRRNHFNALAAIIAYARGRYCPSDPRDFDPLAKVSNPDPPAADVLLYTPEALAWLLNFAESYDAGQKLIPFMCITAFAYVRHEEMNGEKDADLDWRNIHFKSRRIVIPPAVAKKTKRKKGNARAVDMPANLIAWLQPYIRPAGKICTLKRTADALCKLRKKAALAALAQAEKLADSEQADRLRAIGRELQGKKKNALRKSCISYRKALTGDIERVADGAGNSPAMIRQNYLHVDEDMKEAAERWFAIMPTRADVLPLFAWQDNKFGGL